ncbi:YpiF family protein [Rossellomorea sp. BNER]|uniref:YpiF family protein n=1 Tax=Rossellomorea sp. BNER TaxID=2962031 RepID=UPI003AF2D04A|nr:YpiF family protein [Rossellomorea sp. BNER]
MNWNAKDIEMYLKEKQYIDTAVVPLLPVDFDDGMKRAAAQGEFITLLTSHLEHQFKGRILLYPPFTYLKENSGSSDAERLLNWTNRIKENETKYVFYLTSDSDWKKQGDTIEDSLIWIPSIPLENLDEQYKHSIMEDQVKQLLNVIVQKWQM